MDIKAKIKLKNPYLVLLAVILLVFVFYSKTLNGFFQHDEWQTFAVLNLQSYKSVADILKDAFVPKASHFAPLFSLTFNFLFYIFGLNYVGYAGVSIVLHLIIVFLVFILARRLTGNFMVASMSSLLFGLNASSHQATSWIIANINTHGSTIFGLLSLILFSYVLSNSKKRKLLFALSLILLVISLLFKEITIAFFAFIPLTFWLYAKVTIRSKIIYSSIIILLGILYLGFRFFMFSLPVNDSEYVVTKDQGFNEIVYNTLTFPPKIFAQSTIPTWQLLYVSKVIATILPDSIAGKPHTGEFDQFVENVVLQVVDFAVFILAVIVMVYILKNKAQKPHKRIILLSLIFVIINSFIYALSPGRSGSIPVIDSRNIYLPAVGTSIFVATMIYVIARGKVTSILLLFAPLIFLQMYWLNEQLELRAQIGTTRKGILQQIKSWHPTLPEKAVFFMASDTAYYGMAEKIPPFETGLGQALLVWYNPTEKFPDGFFEDKFLRFITDQGYREFDGRGFGYFRDFDKLQETMEKNNLSPESVISYEYYGGKNTLRETTLQIKKSLNGLQINDKK